jgi:hypothetical protein
MGVPKGHFFAGNRGETLYSFLYYTLAVAKGAGNRQRFQGL